MASRADQYLYEPEIANLTEHLKSVVEFFFTSTPIGHLNTLWLRLASRDPALANKLRVFISPLNNFKEEEKKSVNSSLFRTVFWESLDAVRDLMLVLMVQDLICTDHIYTMESVIELSREAGLSLGSDRKTELRNLITKLYAAMHLNQQLHVRPGNSNGRPPLYEDDIERVREVVATLISLNLSDTEITRAVIYGVSAMKQKQLSKLNKDKALDLGKSQLNKDEGKRLGDRLSKKGTSITQIKELVRVLSMKHE
jgi:hypothetical protein